VPVKPAHGGEHRLDNGSLLRSDVHVMFDHGYVSDSFYASAGQVITLPGRRTDRPNPDFLQWHLDTEFKAS
jgi:putative restriction endonuclease